MLLHCILSKEIPKIKCLNNFPVPSTINKYIFYTYLYYHMLKVNIWFTDLFISWILKIELNLVCTPHFSWVKSSLGSDWCWWISLMSMIIWSLANGNFGWTLSLHLRRQEKKFWILRKLYQLQLMHMSINF
jgi:hypothetical protein